MPALAHPEPEHGIGSHIASFMPDSPHALAFPYALPAMDAGYSASSFSTRIAESSGTLRDENLRDCFAGSLTGRFIVSAIHHPLCGTLHIVDDSKSASINATWFALTEYAVTPSILIVGGEQLRPGSASDFRILDDSIQRSVECVIGYGAIAEEYFRQYSTLVRCYCVANLEQAVQTAAQYLVNTDVECGASNATILFSPSAPVHGDFINPAHRRVVFRDAIRQYFGSIAYHDTDSL